MVDAMAMSAAGLCSTNGENTGWRAVGARADLGRAGEGAAGHVPFQSAAGEGATGARMRRDGDAQDVGCADWIRGPGSRSAGIL